jgi:hypothetical protein
METIKHFVLRRWLVDRTETNSMHVLPGAHLVFGSEKNQKNIPGQ